MLERFIYGFMILLAILFLIGGYIAGKKSDEAFLEAFKIQK